MNVLITGSTGMVGNELLKLCIDSEQVRNITVLNRKSLSIENSKVTCIAITDFDTYDDRSDIFENVDAAFFCIGVYTGQVSDDLFKKITVDYAVSFAQKIHSMSPKARVCLLSGAGADRTEKSSTAFARYKGIAENAISNLGIEFYAFRPGYIYPVEKRNEPNMLYSLMRYMYPVIRMFGSNSSIKSTELAQSMLQVGLEGHSDEILENRDIIRLVN